MLIMYNTVKLSPAFKDYLWGGTKLKTDFNKNSNLEKVAESWELSTHKDGESVICEGEYKGKKLSEFIALSKEEILGKNALSFDFFPILIKFIDACDSLSIQVHPDDDYALKNEGEYGKTEMWYILDCDKDAFIYYGFKKEVTKGEYEKAIKENTLLEILNKVEVKKGDVFFIKSGTVHAIGKGNVICEIQQNSNTTYRVYDYNRKDKDGNTRPLHIEKALATSTLTPPENFTLGESKKIGNCTRRILSECKYFKAEKIDFTGEQKIELIPDRFHSVIVLNGSGELISNGEKFNVNKGDSFFIPAGHSDFTIDGNVEIMLSYV